MAILGLRMRCITWPLVCGSKITTRMNFLTLFAYSLCHFYASTMTIKRCSKGSIPIVARTPPKKKLTRFWCAKSRMRRNETPGRIATNCCTGVAVHDVITCADLYYDRLRGLGVAGGQILGFSIDLLRRPYKTLALPCECVITRH